MGTGLCHLFGNWVVTSTPSKHFNSASIGVFKVHAASYRLFSAKSSPERTYYEVLGVERYASLQEIKSAFYAKSKLFHPDNSNDESTSEFVELKTAYDILRRPADRRLYDLQLREGLHRKPIKDFHNPYSGFRNNPQPQYDFSRDWTRYWGENPGVNMKDSDYAKRSAKYWRTILFWTAIGTVFVVMYNAGYVAMLHARERQLSRLVDEDEIAKSFLRQSEFRDVPIDSSEIVSLGRLLKADVDEAWRMRCETMASRNRDEIREEYRWFRAVQDIDHTRKVKATRAVKRREELAKLLGEDSENSLPTTR